MKNIDRIRQMSVDEMANFLDGDCSYCIYGNGVCKAEKNIPCIYGIKKWLESEE